MTTLKSVNRQCKGTKTMLIKCPCEEATKQLVPNKGLRSHEMSLAEVNYDFSIQT